MSSLINERCFPNEASVTRNFCTKADVHSEAEARMRSGKRLVISGFVVAIVGIVGYCLACLSAGLNQDLGMAFLDTPALLVAPTLGLIGLGTLLWLVGSVLFLRGVMDADPEEHDIQ